MKKTIYSINILGWDKYNGHNKRGMKKIMLSTNFLTDAKIRAVTPVTRLLYLSCLLVAGESGQSQIEVSHESLQFQSGVKSQSIQSQLDLLQSLQLVTYAKTPFKERKKEIKERKKESAEPSESDQKPETEQGSLFPARVSKAASRGAIPEFAKDETCVNRLQSVTEKVQRAWLIAYPNADWICQEVRKANAWCETNSHKAPKNFDRFMNSWLSRAFEDYRKGLQSKHRTHAQKNSDSLQEMREKVERGEL